MFIKAQGNLNESSMNSETLKLLIKGQHSESTINKALLLMFYEKDSYKEAQLGEIKGYDKATKT